ncbi:MAG: sigma-70 family RNA polymerase sigma factor [Planctomycetota bacterium]|nr:sigma-70 family RNA polymerase sigma factor [Planctomycetota bacterium]
MIDLAGDLAAAQAGDAAAYERVVARFQDLAYACACAYLGDAHLAQDATQEAFVVAYLELRAGKLREPAAFPGWFRTIVRRQSARLARVRGPAARSLDAAARLEAPEAGEMEPAESARREGFAWAALRALPESYRLVTVLFYFCEYDTPRIAEILGVPVTTVKKRLHDARRRLQDWIVREMRRDAQARGPSRDPDYAERIGRMLQPDALKKAEPLVWSPGLGTQVWAMFQAAAAGDVEALKRLLDREPALARCQYVYRSPLYFAVRENRIEAAAFLLERGADPLSLEVNDSLLEIARDRGYAEMEKLLAAKLAAAFGASARGEPVAAAIRAYDAAKARQLLDADPALLHAGDRHGNQPLHWAVMTRQPELIDELLARGADIDAKRPDGARPLQLTNGDYRHRGWRDVPKEHPVTHEAVFAHLLARGAYFDLCSASHKGDLARVRELLDADPALANRLDPYVTYYPCSGAPLRNAAGAGHLEVVRLLLDRGADPNLPEEGIAPQGGGLYAAAAGGHYEIAKLLLERGAFPNPAMESSADALGRALMRKDQRMVDLLASHGAAQSLEIMAYYGDVRTAAAIFAVDPSQADDPLALANAASEGQEGMMRLILKYQPDLPKRMSIDQNWAMDAKGPEHFEILFQHGLNPSARDWLGVTPLHLFARKGELWKAELFLDRGADLHARDDDLCSTPLGWAAKFNRKEMVELLLKRGAKPNLPDDPPWATPLAWATRRGHGEIVEVLKKHGVTR